MAHINWADIVSLESSIFVQPEPEPELVNPDGKYNCPVHGGLLREPVQTMCGHRLCKTCLEGYLDGEDSKPCPVEDEEREIVSTRNVFPDPGILREMKVLPVYCPHKDKGCTNTIKYREMKDHMTACPYRPAPCRYTLRGCAESVVVLTLPQHEEACGFQPASCPHCGQDFNLAVKKDHQDNKCPETFIPCTYNCGAEVKRREMTNHSYTCILKPKECCYKELGCDYEGSEMDVAEHEKRIDKHLDVLVAAVCDMKMSLIKIPALDTEVITGIRIKGDTLEATVQDLKEVHEEKIAHVQDRSRAAEGLTEQLGREQEGLMQEIGRLKEEVAGLQEKVLEMPNQSEKLNMIEVRLAECDLRFQLIESASYDGRLLWKIKHFATRRRDAVQGRTVSLYSQPFYSSPFGYKMCARIYLNGDGAGKGTHLSIYFVVMKGEYDALLPWPFQLQIALMVLDQSPRKQHLRDSFVPDPTSTSFKRPDRAEMNVASGCPLFAALSLLDNPDNRYVEDDTLFVMVTVDVSNLRPI